MTPSLLQNNYHDAWFSDTETGQSQRGSHENMGKRKEFQSRRQLQYPNPSSDQSVFYVT
jgi:hypothetical protein